MSSTAPTAAAEHAKSKSGTEYVVLRQTLDLNTTPAESTRELFEFLGVYDGPREKAIKDAAKENGGSTNYWAVPARSWTSVHVTVSTETRVTLS